VLLFLTHANYVAGNVLNFDTSTTPDAWMVRVNDVDEARNRVLRAVNAFLARSGIAPFPLIPLSLTSGEVDGARRRAGVL
jgi:hypothetical protein